MQGDISFDKIIDKDHPYYDLIMKNKHRYPNIFDIFPTDSKKEIQSNFPLSIHCRPNADATYLSFIYTFTFPTTPQRYLQLMSDIEFQKKVDHNLQEFKIYKENNLQNTYHYYACYKRIFIIMPRYFIYIRYTFKIGDDIWVIAISDPQAEFIKNKTKGEIVLTVVRLRRVQNGCEISVFSEVDMKMKLKFEAAFSTGSNELLKYLKNTHNAILQQNKKL